ncbi:MAG: Transposase [Verrucomicrobiaceae bacterium]|nr:Transposase [Verrucomicrobiaceae bacterium]
MKTTTPKPTRSRFSALSQLCNLIPLRLVSDLAAEARDAPKARTYSYWSQVVALIYAQLTHAVGLNEVCDSLRLHSGPLSAIHRATPPSRNNLSHANKQRPACIAERLFWRVLEHLRGQHKGFGTAHGNQTSGAPFQMRHPCGGLHHHRVHRQMHGLGQAPQAQGGCQVPPATLVSLLRSYGTGGGSFRLLGKPERAYLPGFTADPIG